jgi:hypothetical protein
MQFRQGIYGEAGERAEGHNEGTGNLPQRRFIDITDAQLDRMDRIILTRIEIRLGIAA